MYPDAAACTATFRAMADRMAALGYATLLPDVYYRAGDWAPFDVDTVFADPDERDAADGPRAEPHADEVVADAGRSSSSSRTARGGGDRRRHDRLLHGRTDLADRRGRTTPTASARRRRSTAGGWPPSDDPDSPRRGRRPRAGHRLRRGGRERRARARPSSSTGSPRPTPRPGVAHTIETYPGAHGFAVPDNGPYDEALAERHWAALAALYRSL